MAGGRALFAKGREKPWQVELAALESGPGAFAPSAKDNPIDKPLGQLVLAFKYGNRAQRGCQDDTAEIEDDGSNGHDAKQYYGSWQPSRVLGALL